MKHSKSMAYTLAVVLCVTAVAVAQRGGGDFDLSWHTIDSGGGGSSTGGGFELAGTIGQPDAGVMTGGEFELAGGFWPGAVAESMPGDCDSDGDVDLDDFAEFEACLTGPGGGLSEPACACFDFDYSGDIDLTDIAAFQLVFSG